VVGHFRPSSLQMKERGNTGAMKVHIEKAHTLSFKGQGNRQVDGDGAFPDPAFS